MNLEYRSNEAGGFLPPVVPTLPSSNANSPSTSSILPHPRSHPLKPGSSKESSLINYVDQKLLAISRRYELRSNPIADKQPTSIPEDKGYKDFRAVATDLDTLVDVIWVSGSRSSLVNECAMAERRNADDGIFSIIANTVFSYDSSCSELIHDLFPIFPTANIYITPEAGCRFCFSFAGGTCPDGGHLTWIQQWTRKGAYDGTGQNQRAG